jgi:type VI secretion system secreted protein Hcp
MPQAGLRPDAPVGERCAMAADFLLKIDGIGGDSGREGHEGAIEVISWSWGVSRSRSVTGGGPAGRPDLDELQVVTTVSGASPQLVESCVTGRSHANAQLVAVRHGFDGRDFEFLRYDLGEVAITNVEHGDDDDGEPTEELALTYRSLTITYVAQDEDGSAGRQTTFSHP